MKRLLLTLLFAVVFFVWYEVKLYQERWILRFTMRRL